MALATLLELEQFAQKNFTDNADPAVLLLLDLATGLIESHCGRTFTAQSTVIETLDSKGSRYMFLSQWPVTAVDEVVENDVTLVEGTDYLWYPNGKVARISGSGRVRWRWLNMLQGVVITYDHGYPSGSEPKTLNGVCLSIAARIFNLAAIDANTPVAAGGIKSVKLEGSDSITYDAAAILGAAAGMKLTDAELHLLLPFNRRGFR